MITIIYLCIWFIVAIGVSLFLGRFIRTGQGESASVREAAERAEAITRKANQEFLNRRRLSIGHFNKDQL